MNSNHSEEELDADSAAGYHIPEEGQEHLDGLPNNDNVAHQRKSTFPTFPNSCGKKSAAWADPDDQNIHVSLASDKRLRKLRDGPQEDTIGGRDYEARLRRQYVFCFVYQKRVTDSKLALDMKRCILPLSGLSHLVTGFIGGNDEELPNLQSPWKLDRKQREVSQTF